MEQQLAARLREREIAQLIKDQEVQPAQKIADMERDIPLWHRADETSQWLSTIPGFGPMTASVPDPSLFRSGRQFAAWLGLTPKGVGQQDGADRLGADVETRRLHGRKG